MLHSTHRTRNVVTETPAGVRIERPILDDSNIKAPINKFSELVMMFFKFWIWLSALSFGLDIPYLYLRGNWNGESGNYLRFNKYSRQPVLHKIWLKHGIDVLRVKQ